MEKSSGSQSVGGAKSAYERKLFEMLVRHELPRNCNVRVDVARRGGEKASANFAFSGDNVSVKSDVSRLGLTRLVGMPPCW
ncbi:MAG TPA: hypothetical protein VEA61_09445 [Allosphingosinicella sp.]|nr:hypothetical protein [Allosphingosinicella sp.]